MTMRYAKLVQQIIQSNMDIIAFALMLFECARSPGIITLVYPFAIFGFALLEERRAGKMFWHFILAYTQLRILIEFVLAQSFWEVVAPTTVMAEIHLFTWRFYLGVQFCEQTSGFPLVLDLVNLFLPNVLILTVSLIVIANESLLDLFERSEQERESIEEAYVRYVRGHHNVDLIEQDNGLDVDQNYPLASREFAEVLNEHLLVYLSRPRSLDDFGLARGDVSDKDSPFATSAAICYASLKSGDIAKFVRDYWACKSENALNELVDLSDKNGGKNELIEL